MSTDFLSEHVPDCAPLMDGGRGHFCTQCSEAAQDYVNWPCPAVSAAVCPVTYDAVLQVLWSEFILTGTQPADIRAAARRLTEVLTASP